MARPTEIRWAASILIRNFFNPNFFWFEKLIRIFFIRNFYKPIFFNPIFFNTVKREITWVKKHLLSPCWAYEQPDKIASSARDSPQKGCKIKQSLLWNGTEPAQSANPMANCGLIRQLNLELDLQIRNPPQMVRDQLD